MQLFTRLAFDAVDRGIVPDFILRPAIRMSCRKRLREIGHDSLEVRHKYKMCWIKEVQTRDNIGEKTQEANEQHYEVSTEFMLLCLGPYAKYSSGFYPTGTESLEVAEVLMLQKYCEEAQLKDGLDILDLGCGWGSLSLYLAENYPHSRITGLSNSRTQKEYITSVAHARGLTNINIITEDVTTFEFCQGERFDRILSIGMFEHMKNYDALLRKVSTWLRPTQGENRSYLFVQVFCHKDTPYHFEENDGWMAKTFFTGGTMPSHDIFTHFQSNLILEDSWFLSGRHYARTFEDWLKQLSKHAEEGRRALEIDAKAKGLSEVEGHKMFNRFRLYFLACAEFFALNGGEEWGEGHYLFRTRS